MALMGFREPNQVKWVGVRPGHRGTQITGHNVSAGVIVDVLQVTAGKKGYITEITIGLNMGAAGASLVYWTDSANAIQETLFEVSLAGATFVLGIPIKYWPPLEIGDNHKIRALSAAAGVALYVTAKGWEE